MGALISLMAKLLKRFPSTAEHASQADGRDLIDRLRQVMFQIDPQGRWTFLNPSWEDLTGFSVRESIGTPLLDHVHPEDRDRCLEYLAAIDRAVPGADAAISLRWLRKDGDSRWVELRSSPISARHKPSAVDGMIGTLNDVTLRVQTEQLQRASHRTLESLIGNLPGMVYRCRNNADWTMDYVSSGSEELTGYRPEDLINNASLAYAQLIHRDDRQRVWNEVQTALHEHRLFDLEYRIVTRQSVEKWVCERGRGLFSTAGELLALEGYIADTTKSKLAERRLSYQLLYDPGTGLPNPALFMDRLQSAVRKSAACSDYCFVLVLLQLDRFAELQSKYGNATADRVAAEIGRHLLQVLDPLATLARMREDRFGMLLEQIYDLKAVNQAVQQMQERVLLPFMIDDLEIYATASIGVALGSTGYTDGEKMLADAATALSRARALGGARFEVFDLRLQAKAAAQSRLERELQDAMSKHEMSVYWQPVVALANGTLVGLEARLAWRHPRRGMLFAEKFVPRATDTQLILPLWEYMLSDACEQMRAWQSLAGFEDVEINIEIFGKTLFDADSILRLGEHLLASKPQSCSLALGVPEGVMNVATDAIKEMLRWLQARQIRLILDSFGAGLSSLSTLARTPIDMIRLHPSLIDECEDGRFIRAIMAFAHNLGIGVIAARIQTDAQLSIARMQGIDYGQGDWISPPIDGMQIKALLKQKQISIAHS